MRDRARRAAVGLATSTRAAVPLGRLLVPSREGVPGAGAEVTWCGDAAAAGRIAVLAHFDPRGQFAEPAGLLLTGLREAGFAVVVVSTAEVAHETLVAALAPDVLGVITRPNAGFDFASWAAAVDTLRRQGADPERVVLLNSSMYGPLEPLGPMLDRLYATGADVMGATESREFRPHLQSYLLAFSRVAWRSPTFASYWRRIRPANDKWGTILAHELGWAHDLAVPPLRAATLVTARRVGARGNPLTFTWRDVVRSGVPLVKRSLFFANHDHVDLTGWRDDLAALAPGFDPGVIERDVLRLTGSAAP
jgi:lipopolysaccharide biosynthesis protein